MSTTDDVSDGSAISVGRTRRGRRWPVVCATVCVTLLLVSGLWASDYQPIVFAGGWAAAHPSRGNHVNVNQELLLTNSGPIGVTVVAISSDHNYGLSPLAHFASPMVCPPITLHGGDCRQNKTTGLPEGVTFHPFSLTTDSRRGVLVRFEYVCHPPGGQGTALGNVTVPVKYRFLWFSRTISFSVPADDSLSCK